jgi:hypothetical protein
MADRTIRNFINGASVDAADGATTDLVNPSTGAVFASAARSRADGGTPHPGSGSWRCYESPMPSRPAPRSSSPPKVRTPASPTT